MTFDLLKQSRNLMSQLESFDSVDEASLFLRRFYLEVPLRRTELIADKLAFCKN